MRKDVDAFLEYLRKDRGFSDNTIEAYKNDLDQFVGFLETSGGPIGASGGWSGVDHQTLLSYVTDLKQRGYAPTTVARKVSATKSLFKFLVSKGKVKAVPLSSAASPQMKRNSPQALSVSEVQRLLAEIEKSSTPEAKRDRAMLQLLYATGMRVSEVISLNAEDIDLLGNRVRCPKGNMQERLLLLPEETVRALGNYLEEARPVLAHGKKEKALFLNRLGQRLTRQGLWQILKSHAEAADLGGRVTPRTLRHSTALHMLRQGTDLRAIQRQLGHANISTTQIYAQVPPEVMRNASPDNGGLQPSA